MKHNKIKKLTFTALLMAMNIVLSSFSIPTPVGGMYLNDIVIVAAAVMLEPFYAFMVGGVGAFIGDLLFYPAPMFVSLAVHGLQAVVISLCSRNILRKKPVAASIIGAVLRMGNLPRRLHSGQILHLFNSRICNCENPSPDSSNCSYIRCRPASLLALRNQSTV